VDLSHFACNQFKSITDFFVCLKGFGDMAPEATVGSILNYVFLCVGMALIAVMLQSLIRFEAIRVQMVWAASLRLAHHGEDDVAKVADEIFADTCQKKDANAVASAAHFKRKMSTHPGEGGLGLSARESNALRQHLDLKRSGSISREAFDAFYQKSKQVQGRGLDVDDIMRRQLTRRGLLSFTIAGMLAYVLICGAVLMALEKGPELEAVEQFIAGRQEFCEASSLLIVRSINSTFY
jgi:hypothetical protein